MNKKTLIIAGVLIAVAIILFLLPSLLLKENTVDQPQNQQGEETENGPLSQNGNAMSFPLSSEIVSELESQVITELDFAYAKAKEWREDVALMTVVVDYKGSIDPRNGKNTYVFFSPTLGQFYFTIAIDQAVNEQGRNSYERLIRYREDFSIVPQNTIVLPTNYWRLTFLDALKKADELGGRETRAKNQTYDTTLILSNKEGELLVWDVEYSVNGQRMFGVVINAYDGTVK